MWALVREELDAEQRTEDRDLLRRDIALGIAAGLQAEPKGAWGRVFPPVAQSAPRTAQEIVEKALTLR